MCQLILRHIKKHIALVFGSIITARQKPTVFFCIILNACVVPRRHIFTTQVARRLEQRAKLNMLITVHTGIRRTPALIFIYKMVDNAFFEASTKIKNMMVNAKLICHGLRIYNVLFRSVRLFNAHFPVTKHFYRSAYNLVTLLLQEDCCSTTVNAATHGS